MKALSWYYERLHFAFWRRWYLKTSRERVLILCLHRITDRPVWEELYNMHPGDLDSLLGGLKKEGFSFVTLDQAFSREKLPPKALCVTCDDGFADNLLEGAPVFRKHQVPYAVFVPTGFAFRRQVSLESMWEFMRTHADWKSPVISEENKKQNLTSAMEQAILPARNEPTLDGILEAKQAFMELNRTDLRKEMDSLYLSAAQVRELAEDPLWTIGSHGEHHAPLRSMNPEQLKENTLLCRQRLEELTGKKCRFMAFPFGGFPDNYLREFKAADAAGYEGTMMFYAGIASEKIIREGHMVPRQDLSSLHSPKENIAFCKKLWKDRENL